jgi:hypothetical protein
VVHADQEEREAPALGNREVGDHGQEGTATQEVVNKPLVSNNSRQLNISKIKFHPLLTPPLGGDLLRDRLKLRLLDRTLLLGGDRDRRPARPGGERL